MEKDLKGHTHNSEDFDSFRCPESNALAVFAHVDFVQRVQGP